MKFLFQLDGYLFGYFDWNFALQRMSEIGFFHSDDQLAEETGLGKRTIARAKKELRAVGFIEMWQHHEFKENGETKMKKHVTAFRIKV